MFFRNYLIFAFIVTLSLGALTYALFTSDKDIGRADGWILHTHRVIVESEQLAAQMQGMVASQRGYILSHNKTYKERYEVYKTNALNSIALLEDLVRDSAEQKARLEGVKQSFGAFAEYLEKKAASFGPVIHPLINYNELRDISLMQDNALRLNSDILKEEYGVMNERIKDLDRRKQQYLYAMLIGGGISGALLLILNVFLLRAQNRRVSAEEALDLAQERLRLAVEGTMAGVYDWDIESDTMRYSGYFFRMLGIDKPAMVGRREDMERLVHPEDRAQVQRVLDDYMAGSTPEYSAVFRLRHVSGRWVWVNSRGRVIRNDQGKPVRMVGSHTDISFIKEHEERMKQEKERAEEANRAKSDFLAHMSHEIRTPLTAISGVAEILNRGRESLDTNQRRLIDALASSTASLKDLINDILDFSKIESGEIDLEDRLFPVLDLFEQVREIMQLKANEKGLDFRFDHRMLSGTAMFRGDRTRVRQILINLIGNAIKFTEKGSVQVIPKLEARNGVNYLRVDVVDTGIGIRQENLDLIFEKFKQADSSVSRRFGGTGLGLPISRQLARLMKGDIVAASQNGQGSTFTLMLPWPNMDETMLPALPENEAAPEPVRGSVMGGHKRVLIVEDYEGNIIVVSFLLEELGCSFGVARTGVEALQMWENGEYDLILMDVQMPEMDGLTATREIRTAERNRKTGRIPIVGMTAHAFVGDGDKCIEAGMDAYLPKPLVENDLKNKVIELLALREAA